MLAAFNVMYYLSLSTALECLTKYLQTSLWSGNCIQMPRLEKRATNRAQVATTIVDNIVLLKTWQHASKESNARTIN